MNPLLDTIPRCHGLKFPRFVTGWMITDLVMLSFHLLFSAILIYTPVGKIFWELPVTSLLVVTVGFFAAIGMLCKRRWALTAGQFEIALCLINIICMFGIAGYDLYIHSSDIAMCFLRKYEEQITLTYLIPVFVLFCTRITLFVFYWRAIVRAGKFFRKRGF